MCEDTTKGGLVPVPDPPAPLMMQTALFAGGVAGTVIGVLFILLALLAECMATLHAVAGVTLAVFGVAKITAGLVSVRMGRDHKRLMEDYLNRVPQGKTKK